MVNAFTRLLSFDLFLLLESHRRILEKCDLFFADKKLPDASISLFEIADELPISNIEILDGEPFLDLDK